MLKNYFKIAWRNLLKSKATSFINISGLAVGMAVAIIIGLWVYDELTFNQYHKNYDHLAQLYIRQTFNGKTGAGQAISLPNRKALETDFPNDFKAIALASWSGEQILSVGDKKIIKEGMYAEPALPEMLTLRMIKGNRKTALNDPSGMIIARSVAKALFGDEDPMNKVVKINNNFNMTVTGVYEDIPYNSFYKDDKLFMSWGMYEQAEEWVKSARTQWDNHSFRMFVQITDKGSFEGVSAKIKDQELKHTEIDGKPQLFLHPMKKWNLYSEFKNGINVGGRITFVWLFAIIGSFVLLLACINFMNLSTARSEKRAKEVGIRKAVGSMRRHLIGQFLSESLLVVILASVLALGLVALCLPMFNQLADKEMTIPFTLPAFWGILVAFILVTGLLAGSYPAFYLSAFNPLKVLKGTFRVGRWASIPRKVLVVIQFTVSIALIIGTIVIFNQIQHAKNRPVNYSREGLIYIFMNTPDLYGHYNALRDDLLKSGGAIEMSQASSPTTGVWSNQVGWEWEGKDPNTMPLFGSIAVSHDYGKSVDWQVIQGHDFSREYGDSNMIILNEEAVKLTGIKGDIIGKTIRKNDQNLKVVGVVKNMVMESPYSPVQPTIFMLRYDWANLINVKLKPGIPESDALKKVEKVFAKYNPGSPFQFTFVDEQYNRKFTAEERIGKLARIFAILAIFISCLGLLGLSAYVAEQRTKEIGIRKVLGASIAQVWMMLSKEFVLLIAISCIVATPITLYVLSDWLDDYDYRIQLSWVVFAFASVMALVITLFTVSYQAIKAAIANPVKSLRSE